jgi:hypothetical protein
MNLKKRFFKRSSFCTNSILCYKTYFLCGTFYKKTCHYY